MAEQKAMWFAADGTPFETEQKADAYEALQLKEKIIDGFSNYHAQMLGKGATYARQFAGVLRSYERCVLSGEVPEVPQEVIDANQRAVEARKQKRLEKEAQASTKSKRNKSA